jgi:uncharacterized iron-regulated protein
MTATKLDRAPSRGRAALLCLAALLAMGAGADVLHLPIGDPARSGRTAPLGLDAVTDAATGDLLSPAELAARLSAARIVLVGELHTSMDFHRAQLRLVQELVATGRPVLIGLEMYPYTQQEHLDHWSQGLLTEDGFVALSHWYDAWGYPWDYYRHVFVYARDHGIPLYGINTPREVVSDVREKGFEGLTEEERAKLPPVIDLDSEEHRRLFRAFFEDEADDDGMHAGMSDEMLDSMYSAQATWDATMGYNAVRVLTAHGDPEAVLVVLVGSGHVAYGLGIERQAAHWFEGGVASVIPIPVEDDDGEPVETVQASYADFVWGLPPAGDPLFPSLGLSGTAVSDDDPRRKVIHVPEDSVAAAAGFAVGDVLLTMDGEPLPDRESFQRRMAGKRWGDKATFTVERGGETVTIEAWFRRSPASG